jgi:hypothetical protein
MNWYVLLTYFDRKIGPRAFLSYPIQLIKEETSCIIADLMDQINSEEFISYSFNHHHTFNYFFEIPSLWARGNKESLMISTVFNHQPSSETRKIIFSLCVEFAEWLKLKEGIFTAFYSDSEMDEHLSNPNIAQNKNHIELWLKEFYWTVKEEIQDKLEEENIFLLLDEKDVLETLGYLSRGSIALEDLKTWYTKQFPDKNFHKMMVTLLKTHMVNIPKINGKKKSPFMLHISKEIKTVIKLIITKNTLIKQFLRNNLKVQPFEEETQELHAFLQKVFSKTQSSH